MATPNRIGSFVDRGIANVLILPLVLSCVSWTRAAEPAATLDKALSRAMDRNPGVIAARAKVALAQAELNTTRLEVARQVIALWRELPLQEQAVEAARKQFQRLDAQYKNGRTDSSQLDAAKHSLIDGEAKLSRTRSDLRYLTGELDLPGGVVATGASAPGAASQGSCGGPKQLLSALRSQIGPVEFVQVPLDDGIAYVEDKAKLSIVRDRQATFQGDTTVTLRLKTASLSDFFQAVEDQVRGARFVVRDYGIFLTDRDHAIQEGFLPVSEFTLDHADSRDQSAATSKASPSVPGSPPVPKK